MIAVPSDWECWYDNNYTKYISCNRIAIMPIIPLLDLFAHLWSSKEDNKWWDN